MARVLDEPAALRPAAPSSRAIDLDDLRFDPEAMRAHWDGDASTTGTLQRWTLLDAEADGGVLAEASGAAAAAGRAAGGGMSARCSATLDARRRRTTTRRWLERAFAAEPVEGELAVAGVEGELPRVPRAAPTT